jgi:hypothetical protein
MTRFVLAVQEFMLFGCTLLSLARPSGFEPEAFPLGGGRSIQLS